MLNFQDKICIVYFECFPVNKINFHLLLLVLRAVSEIIQTNVLESPKREKTRREPIKSGRRKGFILEEQRGVGRTRQYVIKVRR